MIYSQILFTLRRDIFNCWHLTSERTCEVKLQIFQKSMEFSATEKCVIIAERKIISHMFYACPWCITTASQFQIYNYFFRMHLYTNQPMMTNAEKFLYSLSRFWHGWDYCVSVVHLFDYAILLSFASWSLASEGFKGVVNH